MSASVLSRGGAHRRDGLHRRAQEREIRIERGAVYRADLRRSEKINRARAHAGRIEFIKYPRRCGFRLSPQDA